MTAQPGAGVQAVNYMRIDDSARATSLLEQLLPIYATVYAEPPYLENENDVQDFAKSWERRVSQPGFRLAVADIGGQLVGFGFGHQLRTAAHWWSGAVESFDVDPEEWPGRTFALIELAVLVEYRRHGIGQRLHDLLLKDANEERVTLLVRPEREAEPAQRLYRRMGYRNVGDQVPYKGAPQYHTLVRESAVPRQGHQADSRPTP